MSFSPSDDTQISAVLNLKSYAHSVIIRSNMVFTHQSNTHNACPNVISMQICLQFSNLFISCTQESFTPSAPMILSQNNNYDLLPFKGDTMPCLLKFKNLCTQCHYKVKYGTCIYSPEKHP